jgi:hypothetical protein
MPNVIYPRPDPPTVRGIHWAASTNPDNSQLDWWLNECRQMGMGWIKVLDHQDSSQHLCERILAAGMIPIVRLYRGRPNPGRLEPGQVEGMKKLIAVGVRYFEPNNEPNLPDEWQPGQWKPGGEVAVVIDNWLADAATIIDAGGLPGFPALAQCGLHGDYSSIRWYQDAFAHLAANRYQAAWSVLTNGAWIAVHAAVLNHFGRLPNGKWHFDYPYDPIAQADAPGITVFEDDCGLVGGRVATELLHKYFSNLDLPLISTEGGVFVPPDGSKAWDSRYAPVTNDTHATGTVAMFDWIAASYPQMYAMCPWLIANERLGHKDKAWTKQTWYPEDKPPLPVVDAMKASAATQVRPAAAALPEPTIDLAGMTRNVAWNKRGFAMNPTAAFQAYARKHKLGAPLSDEWDFAFGNKAYRAQSFTGGIAFCEVDHWNEVTHIPW